MQTLNAQDCAIVRTWMKRDSWLTVFRDLSLPIYLCFCMDIQREPKVSPVGLRQLARRTCFAASTKSHAKNFPFI
jgi:hypothetical protein